MKIVQLRLGGATNSSSPHNIIIPNRELLDETDNNEFGWNRFICQSRQAKIAYFIASVLSCVEYPPLNYYEKEAWEVREELYQKSRREQVFQPLVKAYNALGLFSYEEEFKDAYVDHQSRIVCPVERTTGKFMLDFYVQLTLPIIENNYVIIGGNDNTEDYEPLPGKLADLPFIIDKLKDNKVVGRYEDYGVVLFFHNGDKMRLTNV